MTEIVKGQELTAVASPTNTTDLSAVADAPAEADAAAEEAPAAEKDEEELAGGHVPMLDLACPDEMGIPEDAPEVPGDGTEMTAMVRDRPALALRQQSCGGPPFVHVPSLSNSLPARLHRCTQG